VDDIDIKYIAQDSHVGRRIMAVLTRKYPGHGWIIEVQHKQGIFDVWNAAISRKFGWRQRIAEVTNLEKCIVFIAGELLERAGLARGPLDEDALMNRSKLITGELAGVDKS